MLLLFYVFLYLCPRCSSISGIVQEPLKPGRQTATLPSWIDTTGIEFISDFQILKKRDPPGPTSPDSLAVAHWIFMALYISQAPLQLFLLVRASKWNPGKWENTSVSERYFSPPFPFREMLESQDGSNLDPWVTPGRRTEVVSCPLSNGLYQNNNNNNNKPQTFPNASVIWTL